jgi:16S rRNA (uracil1498-N3)-methyltransferase
MSNVRLFFPDSILENTTSLLSKEHMHYVVNVMRMKRGSYINFFNKKGEWLSEIIFLDRDRVEVKFLNKIKESSKISNIELAICLVKKTPMEIILQKATELGVSKITPIVSERTEVKELNYERAQKIVTEATEQSNQLTPPKISKAINLKDFLVNLDTRTKFLFADVSSQISLQKKDVEGDTLKTILIGPEGDFSPNERNSILAKENITSFSMSKNILRSDTAVISAISLVNFMINSY